MGSIKVYENGTTFGTAGANPPPGSRRPSKGWSRRSAAANRRFLYGVDVEGLTDYAVAVTLTVKECPSSAGAFHRLRRAFLERVRRRFGLVRYHWVIEWQRRGVPHLHMALFLERSPMVSFGPSALAEMWCDLCRAAGLTSSERAQDVKWIVGVVGWLQYLSKHAGRSAAHYQRDGMPDGWESSGRVWGHGGEWPVSDAVEVTLPVQGMVRYRRLVRAYVIAQARAKGDWQRVAYLRARPSKEQDPRRSRVMGGSEWIPQDVALSLALLAAGS